MGQVCNTGEFQEVPRVGGFECRNSLQGLARIRKPVQLLVCYGKAPKARGRSFAAGIQSLDQRDHQGCAPRRVEHREDGDNICFGEVRGAYQALGCFRSLLKALKALQSGQEFGPAT